MISLVAIAVLSDLHGPTSLPKVVREVERHGLDLLTSTW